MKNTNLFLIILSLVLAIATFWLVIIYQHSKAINHSNALSHQVMANDSLTQENAQLRQLLEAKLESLCDTMTVAEKLAQAELDAFRLEMYREQEAEELKAYNKKEAASLAAYVEKENADLLVFDKYYETRSQSLKDLEENHPDMFRDYAVIVFKTDNSPYDYDEYQKRLDMEKVPAVAKYFTVVSDAWEKRSAEGEKLKVSYQQKNIQLGQEYKNRLQALEKFYQLKIAEKKESLGLL